MLERTFTSGECLRRQSLHTWFTHVICAAAALAGDDFPGRQCTEMMSHFCVHQAYTCGVPNVVENVRQIENEMDSHCWHFLGLKTVNLRSTCAQRKVSLHAWGHTLKWWQELMHHGHMHKGKKEVFKCAPTTLSKLFIILSWHSPLMAQGRLTVMQDLAGHKPSA